MSTIITPGGKHRLPRGWSYPVSAREIKHCLTSLSIPAELRLSFLFRSYSLRASEHLALLRSGRSFPVLEASYSNPKSTIPSTALGRHMKSYLEPTWSLHVCAIPSDSRHICHDALLDGGIKRVRRWLMTERPDTWYQGFKTFTVRVVPSIGALDFKEAA